MATLCSECGADLWSAKGYERRWRTGLRLRKRHTCGFACELRRKTRLQRERRRKRRGAPSYVTIDYELGADANGRPYRWQTRTAAADADRVVAEARARWPAAIVSRRSRPR